jgi:hypothetical protein
MPNRFDHLVLNASRCRCSTLEFGTYSFQSPGYVSVIIAGRAPSISHGSALNV